MFCARKEARASLVRVWVFTESYFSWSLLVCSTMIRRVCCGKRGRRRAVVVKFLKEKF